MRTILLASRMMGARAETIRIIGQIALRLVAILLAMATAVAAMGLGVMAIFVLLFGMPKPDALLVFAWTCFACYAACRNVPALIDLINEPDTREWALVVSWTIGPIAILYAAAALTS